MTEDQSRRAAPDPDPPPARPALVDPGARATGPAQPARGNPDVLSSHDRERRGDQVRQAIGRLPEQQRAVVTAVYFRHRSQAQIAAAFDLPLSTVRRELFRGLRQLGGMLDAEPAQREATARGNRLT